MCRRRWRSAALAGRSCARQREEGGGGVAAAGAVEVHRRLLAFAWTLFHTKCMGQSDIDFRVVLQVHLLHGRQLRRGD